MSEYTSPTPAEGFLDPDDPTLFPRLTEAQIERLAESAETLSLAPGEVVFEQGQRDAPLYVVLSGAIDVIDRQPEGDRYFTQCQPGTFAADVSMFTGEPTIARGDRRRGDHAACGTTRRAARAGGRLRRAGRPPPAHHDHAS